jgi:sterol O-acyltransferase
MMMKCHSYMAVNGYLQWVDAQRTKATRALDKLVEKQGGWDKARSDAVANARDSPSDISEESSGGQTPENAPDGTVTSYIGAPAAQMLRQRIIASQDPTLSSSTSRKPNGVVDLSDSKTPEDSVTAHALTTHPDNRISAIARNLTDMDLELTSRGPTYAVTWPENISLANFADYQLIPTLVYELEYPRTERIRPVYLLEKTIATFGSFALLYTVTAHFILPLVPTREQSFWKSLLDLSIPFMVAYLLLFFIIFGGSLSKIGLFLF